MIRKTVALVLVVFVLSKRGLVSGQGVTAAPSTQAPAQPPATQAPGAQSNTSQPSVTGAPQNNSSVPIASSPLPSPSGSPSVSSSDKVNIRKICEEDTNCAPANSRCVHAGDGYKRCTCTDGYHQDDSMTRCLKVTYGDPNCQQCVNNDGTCLEKDGGVTCSCPSSQTGANCETVLVTVRCSDEVMTVCYKPHENVDLSNGWTLSTAGRADEPQCRGTMGNSTGPCQPGEATLGLSLRTNDTGICGTALTKDSFNRKFSNMIVVSPANESISSYAFNVYCSFQSYLTGKYTGVGVVSTNGNDRGVQVSANLSLSVVTMYDKPLAEGASLLVGDIVRFKVTLQKDGGYETFQVLRCTASSSFMFPDSYARTRTLSHEGCPLTGEPTAASWYWTAVSGANDSTYTMRSGDVPMFRLPNSDIVYMYCTIKLCMKSSQSECPVMTKDTCSSQTSSRRKRAALAPTAQATISAGLRVTDPGVVSTGGMGSPTVLAVALSIAAAVIILVVVVGALMMLSNRRAAREGRQERFALPRLRNTHERF